MISNAHMACQRRVVGHGDVVANLTIVGDVNISHDPVLVSNAGHTTAELRAAIDRAVLPDRIAIANFECR